VSAGGSFAIRLVSWNDAESSLRSIRHAVFVIEQHVPEALEWDEADHQSIHALAEDDSGAPIGCGRLLPTGYIGRMAVVEPWRKRGVGAALLRRLVELARTDGHGEVRLHAQIDAVPVYARCGFTPVGETFVEVDIVHQTMRCSLFA